MKRLYWSIGSSVSLLLVLLLAGAKPLLAQIRSDQTLGNQRSSSRAATINGKPARLIEGGARRRGNLFHSFSEFNVRGGQRVYFDNPAGVERIFSRVTGNNRSLIRGTLGVNGSADLFLLNPNGIIFGPQAQLDVRGSFLATTAERLRFNNGFNFSAVQPEAPPLLTVSVPVGLQFGRNPGDIINRSLVESNAPLLNNAGNPVPIPDTYSVDPFVGLQVASGQTLALVGGDLRLEGGELTAAGGRVELGSVGDSAEVSLRPLNRGWRLGYGQVQRFGNISLSGLADIDTTGAGGGAISLWGDQVQVTEGSFIRANTLGSPAGQDIIVHADRLSVEGAVLLEEGPRASLISTSTFGPGTGGNVELDVNQLRVADGGQIEANAEASGVGGNLIVNADLVELQDVVRLPDRRLLLAPVIGPDGNPRLDVNGRPVRVPIPSGLFVRVRSGATSTRADRRRGNLSLVTNQLQVEDGAQILVETAGGRAAGTLAIQALEIELDGVTLQANGQPYAITVGQGASTFPSLLSTFTDFTRRGGDLQITTNDLRLRAGAVIQTATQNSGDAGRLRIRAETIDIAGTNGTPSALLTTSGGIPEVRIGNPDATGRAGSMALTTESLNLEDGAILAASSLNPSGNAAGTGNIEIQAETILLNNQARLTASSASINGGNINLRLQDSLRLRQNSAISASAAKEGSGGNVDISVPNGFIIAPNQQNNDITATAEEGRGGNITVAATGVFGIEQRQAIPNNRTNDIDASSRFGISGTVTITEPNVDPTRGITELASTPASPEPVQGCQVSTEQTRAEFFNTGRGGLPLTPYEPLSNQDILADLRLPTQNSPVALSSGTPSAFQFGPNSDAVVEANAWTLNQKGQFVLVAQTPASLFQGCHLR